MQIELRGVTSSQIEAIGHDEATNTLAIRFKNKDGSPGSIYTYANVTHEDWIAFASAESIGSAFYKTFKNNPQKYPYTKQ